MNQEFLEFDNSEAWIFMLCSDFQLKSLKRQNSSWGCIGLQEFLLGPGNLNHIA